MSNDSQAILGYVIGALAVLVGLAVGIKQLFWPCAAPGNGSHDVTRREFEELKTQTRETLEDIKDGMSRLHVSLAEIRVFLKVPSVP